MVNDDTLDRDQLIRPLHRRDAEHQWGVMWARDQIEADYGRVFMVGRKRGERDFVFLRELSGKLQSDGAFSIDRLRFK